MSAAHLGLMAALGLACLASSVILHRTASPAQDDELDQIYS